MTKRNKNYDHYYSASVNKEEGIHGPLTNVLKDIGFALNLPTMVSILQSKVNWNAQNMDAISYPLFELGTRAHLGINLLYVYCYWNYYPNINALETHNLFFLAYATPTPSKHELLRPCFASTYNKCNDTKKNSLASGQGWLTNSWAFPFFFIKKVIKFFNFFKCIF